MGARLCRRRRAAQKAEKAEKISIAEALARAVRCLPSDQIPVAPDGLIESS